LIPETDKQPEHTVINLIKSSAARVLSSVTIDGELLSEAKNYGNH